MTNTDRPNPFKAFLPASRDATSCPANAFLVRSAPSVDTRALGLDALDGFLLACADEEVALDVLLARIPCSRTVAMGRVERLVGLGALLIRSPSRPAPAETVRDEDALDTIRPRAGASLPAVE